MKRHQCHDHSSPLMCLMASISSLGFCYSDLALDASLGVICDIIPIAISSKPATQFIPKFKCTHYQVRWKTIKTHLLPYRPPPPFSTRETSPQMCRQQSQKQSRGAVKNNSQGSRGFFFQREAFRKGSCVKCRCYDRSGPLNSHLILESYSDPSPLNSKFNAYFIFLITIAWVCIISKISQGSMSNIDF